MMKKNNGITLISLVVTIVVLLILSSITINFAIGNNSIFANSKLAKEATKKSEIIEYLNLKLLDEQTKYYFETPKFIINKARENINANKTDLKKYGKQIDVKEVVNKDENIYFYVIIDEKIYKINIEGSKYLGTGKFHTHMDSCYHKHTDSCYHKHTDSSGSCYTTKNVICGLGASSTSGKLENQNGWYQYGYCSRGHSWIYDSNNGGSRTCTNSVSTRVLTCTITTENPICEKDNSTIECNKTNETIDSYNIDY